MAHAVLFFFDDAADAAVRQLWRGLERAGVPSLATHSHGRHRPHVSFAIAGTIPARTREALRDDLRLLSIPKLWLSTLSAFSGTNTVLMLTTVVDAELLAVHSTVHDVLAGKVRNPVAAYLPGSWIPHCTLSQGVTTAQVAAGFAAVYPVDPIEATVSQIAVVDTQTGDADVVLDL